MSRFVLECTIDPSRLDVLVARRAEHYAFLIAHREAIVFGGPARHESGVPEAMIIVIEVDDLDQARTFIADEPYHRNGGFVQVRVRPWTQVLPESTPGDLQRTYEAELAKPSSRRGVEPVE